MKKENLIISVGREFGSGGHQIAEKLAEKFGIPLYDYNLLTEIAEKRNLDMEVIAKYDEVPKRSFSRTVRGFNNSPEENIANMQFAELRKKAENGESFVIVGRCAETVLRDFDSLVSIFILGDMQTKIERIAEINEISEDEARDIVIERNKKRKAYHNYYSDNKWGDSRNYDLSINASRLGINETADFIEQYINLRLD